MTTVRNFDVENVFCQDCISTIQNGKVLCLSDLCDVQIIGEATPPRNMRLTGGEPGSFGSTFLGINAGLRIFSGLGTGVGNTFVGFNAGILADVSLRNTFVGSGAGELSTATADNVFVGHSTGGALGAGTAGNTFVGAQAGQAWNGSGAVFIGFNSGNVTTSTGAPANPNTFIGSRTGELNTTGSSNTFIGWHAGLVNTTANYNTFVGDVSGGANTTGANNTFVGATSGAANTTGSNNVFLGTTSGSVNTTGSENVFTGSSAGASNTTGSENSFLGFTSGALNTTGSFNTFLGSSSGANNTTGSNNVFIGEASGSLSSTVNGSTFVGAYSGQNNTTGTGNVFLGLNSGNQNSTSSFNTYLGTGTGQLNTTGAGENTFVGYFAGNEYGETVGFPAGRNVALGTFALQFGSASPYQNVAIGYNALNFCAGGDNNVVVGANAFPTSNASRNVVVGSGVGPLAVSEDQVFLGYNIGQTYISGDGCVAIGSNTLQSIQNAMDSIVIGRNISGNVGNSTVFNSVIIGANSTVTSGLNNTVALGQGLLAANVSQNNSVYFRPALDTLPVDANNRPVVYNISNGRLGPGLVTDNFSYTVANAAAGGFAGAYQVYPTYSNTLTTRVQGSRFRITMSFILSINRVTPIGKTVTVGIYLSSFINAVTTTPVVDPFTAQPAGLTVVYADPANPSTNIYTPVTINYVYNPNPALAVGSTVQFSPTTYYTTSGAGAETVSINGVAVPPIGINPLIVMEVEEIYY